VKVQLQVPPKRIKKRRYQVMFKHWWKGIRREGKAED
jgi:hypothetical protein